MNIDKIIISDLDRFGSTTILRMAERGATICIKMHSLQILEGDLVVLQGFL